MIIYHSYPVLQQIHTEMFSQQSDVSNFDNMECCANNPNNIFNQSWGGNQNCLIRKPEIWPQPTQYTRYAPSSYAPQQNSYFTQPYTPRPQNTNPSPVVSDSFRKQASVADWEAYLYSPINPVNVPQIPVQNPNSEANRYPANNVAPRTNHQAHISFVNTPSGVLKPIVKRKRKRTAFTTEQVEAFETIFYKRPYVSREERQVLMEKLQVSDKAIKVWFQNRRLKMKKEKEEQEMESSDSENLDVQVAKPLAYVEAQIYNADEFGYVTLDDRAVNELVNVIDNYLPKDADLGNTDTNISEDKNRMCSVSESECSVIYEPISPPDLSDGASQETFTHQRESFQAIEPQKSLQNLLDVHLHEWKDANLSVY